MINPHKVLLDRCTRREAITHRTAILERTIQWGDQPVTASLAQRIRRLPRPDEHFKQQQLPFIATIAEQARTGRIKLFTSFELLVERLRNTEPEKGYLGFDLLEGIAIQEVPSPTSRNVSISPQETIGITAEEQKGQLRSISTPRFVEILRLAGDAHVADAYHYWTAEMNGLDAFLTTDKAFWNVFQNIKNKLKSPTRVVTPRELCTELGLGPSDIEALSRRCLPFS